MTQHTTGPWYEVAGCIRADAVEGRAIAIVHHAGGLANAATQQANGRLMAAAPVLLAEHEATAVFLVGLLSDHTVCERGTESEAQLKRRLAAVRAAIAIARGETA